MRRCFRFVLLMILLLLTPACFADSAQAAPSVPAETRAAMQQAYHLPPAKEKQAEALAFSSHLLYFGDVLWGFAVFVLLLECGAVARLERWATARTGRAWLQGILFLPALLLILMLATLPLDAIGHHLSRTNGISVQPWGGWLWDQTKAALLSIALSTPLLMLARLLVQRSPRRYWLWFWALWIPLEIIGVFLVPVFIDPLFNHFEPLKPAHPQLVVELEKVVRRTGTEIPPERMYLMKASEKTNGINAYVTGLGPTKRIVIWDTTADRVPTDQILFIFGHESGHYVLRHIPKYLTFLAVLLFAVLWAVGRVAEWLIRTCGGRWQVTSLGSWGGLVVLLFVFNVAQFLLEPVTNAAGRFEEHQADVYGQEAMHGILEDPQRSAVAAFNTLGEAYLEPEHTNRFLELWSYSHPALERRAEFAAHYNPWQAGARPQFFPAEPEAAHSPASSGDKTP